MNKELYTELSERAKVILDEHEKDFLPPPIPIVSNYMKRFYDLYPKVKDLLMDVYGFTNSDFRASKLIYDYCNQMIDAFKRLRSLLEGHEIVIYPINFSAVEDVLEDEFIDALQDALQLVAHIFGYTDKYIAISKMDYTGYAPLTAENLDDPEYLAIVE